MGKAKSNERLYLSKDLVEDISEIKNWQKDNVWEADTETNKKDWLSCEIDQDIPKKFSLLELIPSFTDNPMETALFTVLFIMLLTTGLAVIRFI